MNGISAGRSVAALTGFLLACGVAAGIGAAVTLPQIDHWYAGLTRPSWTPPNAVFGPVWTALYIAMAVAAWLVWRQRSDTRPRQRALTLFWIQLVLNGLWSPLFFGLHALAAAAIDITLLLIATAAMVALFSRRSMIAGLLVLPYLAWIAYAATLNIAIWRLNPA